MAENFQDVVKQLGSTVKKPAIAKAPLVLAVQMVDNKGKVIKEKTGAAAAEIKREEEKREKRTNTLLRGILKAVSGKGGKGQDEGKGGGGLGSVLGALSLWKIASAALGGIKGAILGALGLMVRGPRFVLTKALGLAKGILKPIATAASGFIKGGLTSAWSMVGNAAQHVTKWGLQGASQLGSIAQSAGSAISQGLSSAWRATGSAAQNATKWGLNAFVNLKNIAIRGAQTVSGAISGVLPKITGVAGGAAGRGAAGAARLGSMMLRGGAAAAKFIPGVGLAVMGAVALYDGLSAGMDEFRKSGDFGKAAKEGAAGALSGITFGLVSQETISSAFDAIGDKFDSLTTGVSTAATAAWDTVKDSIPTKEDLKVSFTKLKDNLAPLSEIKLPTEISFSAISASVTSMAKGLNDSFANITGIDISATLPSIKDGVVAKAGALLTSFESVTGIDVSDTLTKIGTGVTAAATQLNTSFENLTGINVSAILTSSVADKAKALVSSFENITGVKVPTFSELGTSITNIGTSLKDSFSGIMDKATGFFSDTASWFGGLFSTAPEADPAAGLTLTPEQLAEYERIKNERVDARQARAGKTSTFFAQRYLDSLSGGADTITEQAAGGPFRSGHPMIVGEMGPEMILPNQGGQVLNAQRTQQMLQAGIQRGMGGGAGGGGGNTSINTGGNVVSSPTTNYVNNGIAARRPIILAA